VLAYAVSVIIDGFGEFGESPESTGQVRTWRSSGQGQGHRSDFRHV